MEGAVRTPGREELDARAARVELLVFDVDGVLTDGGLYFGPTGEALKRFDVRDGMGIAAARAVGLGAAVMSGRTSPIVEARCSELGMTVRQGVRDKAAALEELARELGVSPSACAYMGDDLNDLAVMKRVALPACPADAAAEVRAAALFVSRQPGGRGAARELVELCLKASGRWERALEVLSHPGAGGPTHWSPTASER